jgi:bifunctional non-homologous end joining protein LigD
VFSEWTSDGILRQPSFQGLREDKPARDVTRDRPQSPAKLEGVSSNGASGAKKRAEGRSMAKQKTSHKRRSTKSANDESRATSGGEVVIAGVRLTNPNRVLYPDHGITKQDLAEYYEQIADWILPYVANRPLTLVRCPEGYAGECFYQKHLTEAMPDAVDGINISEKGKREEYVTIRNTAGLVSLVQMGVLEMHPWPARNDNIERPDYLVFDLDPGEGVEWKDVAQGAKDVRDRLQAVGLTSFLRTSGGKGLHVCAPIQRRTSWNDFKSFAKSVAHAMSREAPDRYIATMSKAKRRAKVFVDYLRNQRGATAIASYSTRRRSGAPVATPLAWDELSAKTRADMYNITNLSKRLERLDRDPWAEFFSTRQSITRDILAAFL